MRAPKLRFKDEDGKEFPEWEKSKLLNITELITKGTTPKIFDEKGNIHFIKIEAFEEMQIDNSKCLKINEKIHNKELKRSILEEHDLLFAIAGSIGKCAIVKRENLPANTNQALAIIRLKKGIHNSYVFQILNSKIMKNYIYMNVSIGAQPNLNLEQIGHFLIPLPNFQEQTKIANFLSAVDERISHINKKVDLLKQYKKGMMQKIFSQEIRFKDENGKEFPEWEEKELGQFTDVLTGNPFKSEDFVEDGIRLLRGMNVKRNMIDWNLESTRFWSRNINNKIKKYNLQEKDVVIAMDGALVGRSYAMIQKKDIPSLLVQRVARLRSDIVSTSFIFYLIDNSSFANYVDKVKTQTAIPHISTQDIKNYSVCLPESKKEQTKIANFLSAIDDKITLVEKQLASTQAYKKGLMQQLFI